MNLRRALFPATALAILAVAVLGMPVSGATFVGTSNGGVSVAAAADWTPPTVSVDDPGPAVSGTATIAVTAADARTGVASVTVEYAAADSGAWRTLCTDTVAPYSCTWSTTSGAAAVPDGAYDLRATAVDVAGYTATSAIRSTRVVNSAAVVLSPVADPARGQVALAATYLNGGNTTANLWFEYAVAGSGTWKAVPGCGYSALVVGSSRTCTFDTSGLTGEYDVRAVALTSLSRTYVDVQAGVTVDNTAPSVQLSVPAGTLSGTVLLTATALDADAGMASVTFQYRRTGTSTWTDCGTDTTDPWACSLLTTSLADGSYDLRAVALDQAGNAAPTAVQARTVNNTVSSVSITGPAAGDVVRGVVTVTADANSTAGVASVAFEVRPTAGTWTTVCTDAAAPYSCAWDTSAIAGASEELRAVLTDGAGAQTVSATVPITVDNQVLRAVDVQVADVAGTGVPAAGDRIVLTWSTVVDLTSIQAGWTGASTALSVTLADGSVTGAPRANADWSAFGNAALGKLSLAQDYVRKGKSASFGGTMTATTQTVGGVPATVVTVTLGSATGTANLRQSTVAGQTTWYPSTAVRTSSGLTCSPSSALESGLLDSDF